MRLNEHPPDWIDLAKHYHQSFTDSPHIPNIFEEWPTTTAPNNLQPDHSADGGATQNNAVDPAPIEDPNWVRRDWQYLVHMAQMERRTEPFGTDQIWDLVFWDRSNVCYLIF